MALPFSMIPPTYLAIIQPLKITDNVNIAVFLDLKNCCGDVNNKLLGVSYIFVF
jgi:hypothetical protein